MADVVCHPKKLRLGDSATSDGGGGGGGSSSSDAAAAMLRELRRKCTCAQCGQLASGPMAARCGHCVCEACAGALKVVAEGGAAAAAAASTAECGVCGQPIRPEELKRDHATGKLLNAMQVLQEHVRSQQESQPNLERARCADCLRSANAADGDANGDGNAAASGLAGAVKRCESLRRQLDQLVEAGDREDAKKRRLLDGAASDLDDWRDRLVQLLAERHTEATKELEQIRHRAETLLAEETARREEARAAGDKLRRLLDAAAAATATATATTTTATEASLRAGEAEVLDLLGQLKAAGIAGATLATVGGKSRSRGKSAVAVQGEADGEVDSAGADAAAPCGRFELSRRSDPETLSAGFAGLLAQLGVDLVVRPYPAIRADLRPARIHRTGSLEPWDFGLLTNVDGLWYTPGGEVRLRRPAADDAPEPDWKPLPRPCLLVNYKGYKTKKLHLFDAASLTQVATVALQLKDGRLPGTIYVCNERQLILTVDHGRCKVSQFDLTGRLVRKLGRKGTGPSQFRQPMTAWLHADLLYVVDSDNKRLQMFHAESLEPRGSLAHDGFSTDIHSVLVNEARIVVTDRENGKAFVFDRASRTVIREVSLAGKPFSLAADSDGNIFVSLTNERKVQVYDAAFAHLLHSLPIARRQRRADAAAIAAATAGASSSGAAAAADDDDDDDEAEDSSSSSDGGGMGLLAGLKLGGSLGKPPFIYGVAIDSAAKRLFVADTFCHAILAYQL